MTIINFAITYLYLFLLGILALLLVATYPTSRLPG